jgi:hypothetical protein
MKKQKDHAFGKDVYLLGMDKEGQYLWLEAPTWDCDWYWGFGYVEQYTVHKNPGKSKDIQSHTHLNYFIVGPSMAKDGGYCYNPFDSAAFSETTFTEKEGGELGELFEQFYFLKKAAENFRRGKCHVANAKVDLWKGEAKAKEINEVIIPKVTARILEILAPETEDKA